MVFRTVFARLFDANGNPLGTSNPLPTQAVGTQDVYIVGGSFSVTAAPPKSNACTQNAPVAVGTVSTLALAANPARVRYLGQNVGIYPIYVLHGATGTPGPNNFTYILRTNAALRDGWGGDHEDSTYKGAVQIASPTNGGLGNFQEETLV